MCDCPVVKEKKEFSRNRKDSITNCRIMRHEVWAKLNHVGKFKKFGLCPLDNG